MAIPLPKMEKKLWILWMSKKKKLSFSQYFYNIFTINYTWLIIISSKNLWQINYGNGIAEIIEKNQVQLTRCKLKYNIFILKWCKQKKKKYSEHKYNIHILKWCNQKQKKVLRTQVQYSYSDSEVLWTKTKKKVLTTIFLF